MLLFSSLMLPLWSDATLVLLIKNVFRTALIAEIIISVIYFRNSYRINCLTVLCTFSEFVRFSRKLIEFLGTSTNSTLGKRASFSQNLQKWHHSSEAYVFREHLITSLVFGRHLLNSWEHLQIIPLGNVRLFLTGFTESIFVVEIYRFGSILERPRALKYDK